MTCEHRDDVAAQLLGGLPPEQSLEVDRHVLTCDECAEVRRELAIVPALLATVERPDVPVAVPADLGDAVVARLASERRRTPWLRPFLAGVAAAVLVGMLPLGAWTVLHRPGDTTVTLAGTSAAPDAWAEARVHARASGGTLVDLEAGDLPSRGASYVVSLVRDGTVLATQRFRADRDGWGQVVLSTDQQVHDDFVIDVVRQDGPRTTPVLRCSCDA